MSEKPFRFGLERVRELRVHDEDRAKEAFAASLNQRLRGAAMLAAADARLRDALVAAAPQPDTGLALSGPELLAHQGWLERLERSKAEAAVALHRLDADLMAQRSLLTDASRRREALERLKERRGEEHRRDASRREAAALDEMAMQAHVRKAAA